VVVRRTRVVLMGNGLDVFRDWAGSGFHDEKQARRFHDNKKWSFTTRVFCRPC
jgi:hypothetical protein